MRLVDAGVWYAEGAGVMPELLCMFMNGVDMADAGVGMPKGQA